MQRITRHAENKIIFFHVGQMGLLVSLSGRKADLFVDQIGHVRAMGQ
jgi:hypothetical protein